MNFFVRALAIAAPLFLTFPLSAAAADYSRYKNHEKYDSYFSKYSKRYFGPGFDWKIFKAQAAAESDLNPKAESWAGAQGVMQIMPPTYEEIQSRNKYIAGQASEPRWNIAAGIWYDKQLFDSWTGDRVLAERMRFMFGSYNAGMGNVLKAQGIAVDEGLDPLHWQSIEKALPKVTGDFSQETIEYVKRIEAIKEGIK